MRNTWQEAKLARRLFQLAGLGFLLGTIALAVGTELIILDLRAESPASFWCWQGVWIMINSIILSKLAAQIKPF